MSDVEQAIGRMRQALARRKGITEKRMFGGVCFMLNDNMMSAASKRGFMFRVGVDAEKQALRPGVRRAEMRGRGYPGYLRTQPDDCSDTQLRELLALAVGHVGALPPKASKKSKAKKAPPRTARS